MQLTERTYRKAEVRITGPDVPVDLLNPVRVAAVESTARAFDDRGEVVASIEPVVEVVYSEGIVVYRDALGVEWYVERIGCGCQGGN